ncbi:MAG: fibronectin type III domain-containing protein, partial [bacterium]|nr:fibronectin type III domain-containing protein [bacterium]
SSASNSLPAIVIDVHRPQAIITDPADGSSFEGSLAITAECPDQDLVTLRFQYRAIADTTWTDLAGPLAHGPYTAVFAPGTLGTYALRALAADQFGQDPAPQEITVEAADLAPESPLQLTATVDGGTSTLTWIAPPDPSDDLDGYHVYRDTVQVTPPSPLPPTTVIWEDSGLADGSYEYQVSAVDEAGQESDLSSSVTAEVYTPSLNHVLPVTTFASTDLSGAGARPGDLVELRARAPDGTFATLASVTS